MPHPIENVLLLYTDPQFLVKPVYPFGLDLIADRLRRCGCAVSIATPFLPDPDPEANLGAILSDIRPDLIGLGIRNIDTAMACEPHGNLRGDFYRARYFLPDIRKVVTALRRLAPAVPMIAGGSGFTVSPRAMLAYLGLDFGIAGDGASALPRFIEAWPRSEKMASIPGLIYRTGQRFRINPGGEFAFGDNDFIGRRSRRFAYAYETAGMPVQIKRGCNQHCAYCVEPIIEGRRFAYRATEDILRELYRIAARHETVRTVFFTDTEFNVPDFTHGARLLEAVLGSELRGRFRFSSQFLPRPFDTAHARLLADAGCTVILTGDSFADGVLAANGAAYRQADIVRTLELCESFGLDCTVNLIFGLPGETRATLDHTPGNDPPLPGHIVAAVRIHFGRQDIPGDPVVPAS